MDESVRIVCREMVLAHVVTGEVHHLGTTITVMFRSLLPIKSLDVDKMWILTKGGAIKVQEEDVWGTHSHAHVDLGSRLGTIPMAPVGDLDVRTTAAVTGGSVMVVLVGAGMGVWTLRSLKRKRMESTRPDGGCTAAPV